MLGAQGIRATGFKRAQGNAHCAKFESHTNRVTFETNAISVISSVHPHYVLLNKLQCRLIKTYQKMISYILIPTPASYPESRDLAKKIRSKGKRLGLTDFQRMGIMAIRRIKSKYEVELMREFLDTPLCWGTSSPSIPLLKYDSTNIYALHTLQTIVHFLWTSVFPI